MDALLLKHDAPKVVQDSLYNLPESAEFSFAYRLLRKDGFAHVLASEKIGNDQFKIFYVCNNLKNARLGIVASKRLMAGSVDRNRIKRIIREAFRQHNLKQSEIDLVVMVRRASIEKSGALMENLKTLFSRLESRCAKS